MRKNSHKVKGLEHNSRFTLSIKSADVHSVTWASGYALILTFQVHGYTAAPEVPDKLQTQPASVTRGLAPDGTA